MSDVVIRHPTPEDPLHLLFPGLEKFHVEPENCFVAEVDGRLAGGVLVFDGGHGVVHVGELVIPEAFRSQGVGTALMYHAREELRQRGKKRIVCWTESLRMAATAEKHGATVTTPLFLIVWEMPDV